MAQTLPLAAICLAASALLALGGCNEAGPPLDAVTVPSGRLVTFLDVVTNAPGAKGATARFRFVVPDLTAQDDASADMEALCNTYALPRIGGMVPEPQQIIVVLANQAVPFGQAAPDAVQFFEAYSVTNGSCMWELL